LLPYRFFFDPRADRHACGANLTEETTVQASRLSQPSHPHALDVRDGGGPETRSAFPSGAELPLPTLPEQVDAGWLSRALALWHPGAEVTDARIGDVICGASTKIRVSLRYNQAGDHAGLPPTLIVKGGFEAHSPLMKDLEHALGARARRMGRSAAGAG